MIRSKLGEVLEQVSRSEPVDLMKEYPLLGIRLEGAGAFHRETKLGSQISANTLFKVSVGDFIYSRLFAWRGAFDVIDVSLDSFYVSNEFPTFLHKKDKIDAKFLRLWFRLPRTVAKVEALCAGSTPLTRNRLKEDKFLDLEIPLPPLEEQRRIVARIEGLAAKIEEARGLRQEATDAAHILLNNELKTVFNTLARQNGLRQLGDMILEANYGTSIKCTPERVGSSIPVLRIPNVSLERLNFDNMKYGFLSNTELEHVRVKEGDLLVVRTNGSIDLVGRCAVVHNVVEPTAFASYLIRLRCDDKLLDPDYVQMALKHLRISGYLIDFARTTAGQYNISLGRLRAASIPVPFLKEQRYVVDYFNNLQAKLDMIKPQQSQTSIQLDALFSSILDRAFKGEL